MEEIRQFVENRPDVVAAYAYGSKVFKQENAKTSNSLIDLIFVVDDMKKWHEENKKENPKDYSMIGSWYFENAPVEKLKGNTDVAYISDIEENGLRFKFGTIEYQDLLLDLQTWRHFYIPARFQKTLNPIIEDIELTRANLINRKKALLVASYLQSGPSSLMVTKKNLYNQLVGLSYMGDPRMVLGETPDKVKNIVNGSFDEFCDMYPLDTSYLQDLGDNVIIDKIAIEKQLDYLPLDLKEYIALHDGEITKENIKKYLEQVNKREGWAMMMKAPKTNGVVRSLKYGARKVGKKFGK